MNSSCPAAVTSFRMSTSLVALLRNGLILKFQVRVLFLFAISQLCFVIVSSSCLAISFLRWYLVLQVYVRHEQHRVGLQVYDYRRPQGSLPDRYVEINTPLLRMPKVMLMSRLVSSVFTLCVLLLLHWVRFWDPEANVGWWSSAQSTGIDRHLGVANGRGLSPDWEPETESHSPLAPPPAVSIPDVRGLIFTLALSPWLVMTSVYPPKSYLVDKWTNSF